MLKTRKKNPDSVLNYYKKLVSVRKSPEYIETFTYGEFIPAYENTETVVAYYRVFNNKRYTCYCKLWKGYCYRSR